jgi:hypothetical protein
MPSFPKSKLAATFLKLGTMEPAWSHHINKIQPIYYYCGESRCAATGCSIDSSVEFIQSLEHILLIY